MARPTDALRAAVRDVIDFPKPGILFKDITPILGDGSLLRIAVDCLVADCAGKEIRKMSASMPGDFSLEPPSPIAGIGFVPASEGSCHGKQVSLMQLEYGEAAMEVHIDAFEPGERVSLIDDLLATGAQRLPQQSSSQRPGNVVQAQFLIELEGLDGRAAIARARKVNPRLLRSSPIRHT